MTFRLDWFGLVLGYQSERFWTAVLLLEREGEEMEDRAVMMTFCISFLVASAFRVCIFLFLCVVGSLILGTFCYCSVLLRH
jgi:hypothetical protein